MSDEELMAAVCRGEEQAYQALVRRHLPAISNYCYRLLGARRDCEDVSQETFLRLWLNAEKWQPDKARLTTWLHRIAHNLCIDLLRKQSRVELEAKPESIKEAMSEMTETAGDRDRDERRLQLIADAMRSLPEAQRSALSLCHHSGFSNQEAAAIMGLSVKALESALVRGRRSLREMLAGNEQTR